MSNCIQLPDLEMILTVTDFDYSKLTEQKDLDGNCLVKDGQWFVFRPATFTTWRELRNFVRTHIAPFCKTKGLRVDLSCREESDNFEELFEITICLDETEYDKSVIG
jgi:hypothetical protein